MGGCRCSFRDCKVSTSRYPNMHFFHFPLKDKERLQKWVDMAAAEYIKGKPLVYQKNRVVCARHFRDECFMNYKKDRLVQSAVPTLMRFGKLTALDYEQDEPTIISLPKPTMSHLIGPPDFKDPLEFDVDEEEFADLDLVTETKDNQCKNTLKIEKSVTFKRKKQQTTQNMVNKKPKILNKNANCQQDSNSQDEFVDFLIPTPQEENITIMNGGDQSEYVWVTDNKNKKDENPHFVFSNKKDLDTEYVLEQIIESPEHIESSMPEDDLSSSEVQISELKEIISNLEEQLAASKRDLKVKNDKLKEINISKNSLKNSLDFMRNQRDELKSENDLLKQQISSNIINANNIVTDNAQQNPMPQVSTTVCSSKDLSAISNVPTKAQLFKGIKKYLSASMVALVRMEMFGNSERIWKPDEVRTSIDLLQLGENVYRYFTDEWRFRLPAISEVRNWLTAQTPLDEDEDL